MTRLLNWQGQENTEIVRQWGSGTLRYKIYMMPWCHCDNGIVHWLHWGSHLWTKRIFYYYFLLRLITFAEGLLSLWQSLFLGKLPCCEDVRKARGKGFYCLMIRDNSGVPLTTGNYSNNRTTSNFNNIFRFRSRTIDSRKCQTQTSANDPTLAGTRRTNQALYWRSSLWSHYIVESIGDF